MTLILTLASRSTAIQASDRLLTLSGPRLREYDDVANKSVVVLGGDYLVALGYAGLAYVGSLQTDQWIAQTLMEDPDVIVGAINMGGQAPPPLHVVTKRLVEGLTRQRCRRSLFNRYALQISVVGLRLDRRRRPHPLLWHITSAPGASGVTVERRPLRHLQRDEGCITAIGSPEDGIMAKLDDDIASSLVIADVRSALVEAVRRTSARDPGVGQDVMVVQLTWSQAGAVIDTEYVPADRKESSGFAVHRQLGRVYTPTLITPGTTYAPLVVPVPGGLGFGMGGPGYKFNIRTAKPSVAMGSGRFTILVSRQTRRGPPGGPQ